jgi:hypothetical protein
VIDLRFARAQGALCDYSMFYNRLRTFISGWEVTYEGVDGMHPDTTGGLEGTTCHEGTADGGGGVRGEARPVKLAGPSGAMSALLPTVDAFLGIKMSNGMHAVHTQVAARCKAAQTLSARRATQLLSDTLPSAPPHFARPYLDDTPPAFLSLACSTGALATLLTDFETYMPREHAAFVRTVRDGTPSLRDYLVELQAAAQCESLQSLPSPTQPGGSSASPAAAGLYGSAGLGAAAALASASRESPEEIADAKALVSTYNECINRVLDFRWRHFQLVQKYIIDQARQAATDAGGTGAGTGCPMGTGGTPAFEYLHQHIHDTEVARIQRPRPPASASAVASPLVVGVDGASPLPASQRAGGAGGAGLAPFALTAAARSIASLESSAAELWAVSGANGLLPTHPPHVWRNAAEAPGGPDGFGVLVSLARAIPSLSAGTGLFKVRRGRFLVTPPRARVRLCVCASVSASRAFERVCGRLSVLLRPCSRQPVHMLLCVIMYSSPTFPSSYLNPPPRSPRVRRRRSSDRRPHSNAAQTRSPTGASVCCARRTSASARARFVPMSARPTSARSTRFADQSVLARATAAAAAAVGTTLSSRQRSKRGCRSARARPCRACTPPRPPPTTMSCRRRCRRCSAGSRRSSAGRRRSTLST